LAAGKKRAGKRTPRPPPLPKRAPARPAGVHPVVVDRDPEIQVSYGPAGRETLAAITDDLLTPPARDFQPSAPQLEFRVTPAGRETFEAITHEYQEGNDEPATGVRARDRVDSPRRTPIVTHPGVAPPANPPTGGSAPVGRDTLDAIAKAVLREGEAAQKPPSSSKRSRTERIDVFELANFVVRGDDLGQLTSEATRREFVADRLLHRLPVSRMELVERVDIAPWSVKGTLILRVWCRIVKP